MDYFPPMLEVASKLKHLRQPLFLAIFGKAPTPEAAKKVRLSTWAKLLQRNAGDPDHRRADVRVVPGGGADGGAGRDRGSQVAEHSDGELAGLQVLNTGSGGRRSS